MRMDRGGEEEEEIWDENSPIREEHHSLSRAGRGKHMANMLSNSVLSETRASKMVLGDVSVPVVVSYDEARI